MPPSQLPRRCATWSMLRSHRPITPCASVHTAFMRYPIDIVFLDRRGRILTLDPWPQGLESVMKILSELGTDLSRFANVKHFCSWLGLCPATKISGGKVISARTRRSANRVRQALKMAAMSLSHSDSALGAFYRKLCTRMDKPRANTATAHKLARLVYFMLTRGDAFVDEGQQRYEEQQRERSIAALKRRAATLGFQINPIGTAA